MTVVGSWAGIVLMVVAAFVFTVAVVAVSDAIERRYGR